MTGRGALPSICLITPEPASGTAVDLAAFVERLSAALTATDMLVQLRVKSLDANRYAALAVAALEVCRAHRARMIVNGPLAVDAALALDADGVHLNDAALRAACARPLPADRLLSVACHDAVSLDLAARLNADCATLSPVLPTASHPGAPALGWTRFAALAARAAIPVYALGGMTRAHLSVAQRHGAHGVAGIRGFW